MHFRVFALLFLALPLFAQEAERFPLELVKFVPHVDGAKQAVPVFRGAGPDHWDAAIRERGWILREGDAFKMWYTGYDGTREGIRRLGYATSADGITWRRHPRNPLLPDVWVEDMMVVPLAGKYYMFAEGKDDQAQLLVSEDGIDWTRRGRLDVRKKNGEPIADGPFGTPTAWHENGVWYLFYERSDLGVWLATSRDMKVWTHVQDEPVLAPGGGVHERDLIALNQIVKHKGRYYAYYHGSARAAPGKGLWSTCVATSTDLVKWQQYPGNPLFPMAQNKSSGILVSGGRSLRFYTMHPEVYLFVPENEK